jgi:hypothetical protein
MQLMKVSPSLLQRTHFRGAPMTRFIAFSVVANVLLAFASFAAEPNEVPAEENSAALYLRAASLITLDTPAASNMEYREFPPFPREWMKMSEEAWPADEEVRELSHQARSINIAIWPQGNDYRYLNQLRNLANHLGDGCLYEGVRHHSAAAIEIARDEIHLADMVSERPSRMVVRILVGQGIMASISNRILVLAPDLKFTSDPRNTVDLNIKTANELIANMLDQRDPEKQLVEVLGPQGSPAWKDPTLTIKRVIETMNRGNAERTFVAMSLACQLYRNDHGAWPASIRDLRPKYLPSIPIDPWGNGRETFGYVLIKGGLPDGSDRPLVYSRCGSQDGLAYRLDEPQYGFYQSDGSARAQGQKPLQLGQFRDLARWEPNRIGGGQPRTAPLDEGAR